MRVAVNQAREYRGVTEINDDRVFGSVRLHLLQRASCLDQSHGCSLVWRLSKDNGLQQKDEEYTNSWAHGVSTAGDRVVIVPNRSCGVIRHHRLEISQYEKTGGAYSAT